MAYKKLIKVSNVCQLLDKSKYNPSQTRSGITWTNNGDGSWTANGIVEKVFAYVNINRNIPFSNLKGHIIYICIDSTNLVSGVTLELRIQDNKGNGLYYRYDIQNDIINLSNISSSGSISISALAIYKDIILENYTFKPQLFDLTEMYGAGNEPTSVEQFRQDFPKEMYDYSPHCWLTSYKRVFMTGGGNYLASYQRNLTCKTKNLLNINKAHNLGGVNAFDTFFINGNSITATSSNLLDRVVICNLFSGYLTAGSYCLSLSMSIKNTLFGCRPNELFIFVDNSFHANKIYASDGDKLVNFPFTLKRDGNVRIDFYKNVQPPTEETFIDNIFSVTFSNIQLEKGSTATGYVPYGHL